MERKDDNNKPKYRSLTFKAVQCDENRKLLENPDGKEIYIRCPLCFDIVCKPTYVACAHCFCEGCFRTSIKRIPFNFSCPMCDCVINIEGLKAKSLQLESAQTNMTPIEWGGINPNSLMDDGSRKRGITAPGNDNQILKKKKMGSVNNSHVDKRVRNYLREISYDLMEVELKDIIIDWLCDRRNIFIKAPEAQVESYIASLLELKKETTGQNKNLNHTITSADAAAAGCSHWPCDNPPLPVQKAQEPAALKQVPQDKKGWGYGGNQVGVEVEDAEALEAERRKSNISLGESDDKKSGSLEMPESLCFDDIFANEDFKFDFTSLVKSEVEPRSKTETVPPVEDKHVPQTSTGNVAKINADRVFGTFTRKVPVPSKHAAFCDRISKRLKDASTQTEITTVDVAVGTMDGSGDDVMESSADHSSSDLFEDLAKSD